jgi:hypothetical protein
MVRKGGGRKNGKGTASLRAKGCAAAIGSGADRANYPVAAEIAARYAQ